MNPNTSAVFTAAMDSVRDEMAKNAKDGAIGIVGEFLTALLNDRPEIAEKITAKDKSLSGAMKAMSEEARKHKTGNYACLDMNTGLNIVLKYFDLPEMSPGEIMAIVHKAAGMPESISAKPESAPAQREAKPAANDFDIDALLDGLEG